jgi:translocation and assembly module TamB
MARRHSRYHSGGRRRWAVFSLATLAVLAAAAWLAPRVLVLTGLRDRPLEAALAGIDGDVSSGSAAWHWLGGIEYRDILLRDRMGRAVVAVPRLVIDRGLLALALAPRDLGTVRLVGAEAVIDVRAGGSSLEDVIAPWLAGQDAAAGGPAFELELADATVEFRDVVRGEAWRLTDVSAVGAVRADEEPTSWTVAGRVRHVEQLTTAPPAGPSAAPAPPAADQRLDRTTVAAAAAAALARDGGFSLSCPVPEAETRTVTIAAHRLPLGVSAVLATRLGGGWVCDGLADVRLDATLAAATRRLVGTVAVEDLAVCRGDSLAEVLAIDRCAVPVDCELRDGRLVVRKLTVSSPMFRAEASGRIRLPTGGPWDWAEGLVDEDFAIAADIDLAAAARALPGGLTVRPDVRITDGRLDLAAAAHADGDDRVLEVRATSRDLAVSQGVAAAGGARPLRWTEPFTAFLKGRRRPGEGLRLEDGRISSSAVELAASGDARSVTLQWTADLGRFAAEAAEVFDMGGLSVAGDARGRVDVVRADPTGPGRLKVSASVSKLDCTVPGRPAWQDAEITLDGEATGRLADGAALVDEAHAVVAAAADRLEATLTGGAVVTFADGVRVRAAAGAEAIAADCSLAGDLGRWQPRLAAVWPAVAASGTWSGTLKSAAALAARGAAWQVTRAGAEIEKFAIRAADRRIDEPRVVATAAGTVHPETGRIDVSSGEILSTTLSVRTGGLSWLPAAGAGPPDLLDLWARLRGKAQWRAHAGRLEAWIVPAGTAADWPVGGELSGTLEVADTPAGANLLVEATGTQLAIAHAAASGRAGGPAQPVWGEPQARLVLEVTRPAGAAGAEAVRIDRLGLESSTVAVSARGSVQEWTGRRLVELEGTAAYDWAQVSRLLVPWTGGRLKVTGAGSRPFAFRGPLGRQAAITPPEVTRDTAPAVVSLPDDWLSAARGGDAGARAALVARPVKATPPTEPAFVALARGVAVDTSAAWMAAEIDGFALGAGEMPVRLFEGQLAFGPFDVAAAGGRLRGAPWVRLAAPAELIVPQGRLVDRVALAGPLCDRWVGWLSPLLGHATHTRGVVTIDVAGGRLPLANPFAGELAGQVVFDEFEVTPAGAMQPLVNLLAKLQAVVDPRFAFGDKVVLLRVRPDPITVRLAEGRLWHEGLVMDSGPLVVRSRGSVAADGTLAMLVEVALRGDIVGQAPVVAQLVRTPLAIPLKGTVHRPQFDAQAIDVLLGRIVENTAQAVIQDGVVRGLESLETLFGNPPPAPPQQPAPAPPPLTFPGGR